MKTILWKLRFTFRIRKLLRTPWLMCWEIAGANLENVRGDTTECPLDCAQEEAYAWAADCMEGEE